MPFFFFSWIVVVIFIISFDDEEISFHSELVIEIEILYIICIVISWKRYIIVDNRKRRAWRSDRQIEKKEGRRFPSEYTHKRAINRGMMVFFFFLDLIWFFFFLFGVARTYRTHKRKNTKTWIRRYVLRSISITNLPPRLGEVLFKLFRYRTVDVFVACCVAADPVIHKETHAERKKRNIVI